MSDIEELSVLMQDLAVKKISDITNIEDFRVFVRSFYSQFLRTMFTEEYTYQAYLINPPVFEIFYLAFCEHYEVHLEWILRGVCNQIGKEVFFSQVLGR